MIGNPVVAPPTEEEQTWMAKAIRYISTEKNISTEKTSLQVKTSPQKLKCIPNAFSST